MLHNAGNIYRRPATGVAPDVDVFVVQYPGREDRLDDPPSDSVLVPEAENVYTIYDGLGDVFPANHFREKAMGDTWQTVTRRVATILDGARRHHPPNRTIQSCQVALGAPAGAPNDAIEFSTT
ncbi:hypothetical protein [Rhodococcus sp. SJ-3]|uniref:hypothetical protein n=1 Tax=Rhodococcus sp. SJ-3 TaxID=3454628 RepID=UPI003F79605B